MILARRQRTAAGLATACRRGSIQSRTQDHVGVADRLRRVAGHVQAGRERMQRMLRRKAGAGLDVGEHDGAQDARPVRRAASKSSGSMDTRPIMSSGRLRRFRADRRRARPPPRSRVPGIAGSESDRAAAAARAPAASSSCSAASSDTNTGPCGSVSAMRYARRIASSAAGYRSRLVVPLACNRAPARARSRDVWIQSTHGRRLHRVDRADAAEQQNRNAIAPRVEDRHRRVHQPDVGVQRDGERPSR